MATVKFYVDCAPDTAGFPEDPLLIAGEDEIQIGGSIYIDPSGVVLNSCTGAAVPGATATIKTEWPPTSGLFVTPSTSATIPSTNPQTTSAFGSYGWVVIPGDYRVDVQKTGYISTQSAVVTIPPAVTDLNIPIDPDIDSDTVKDCSDNCPNDPNPGQENPDGDEYGSACEPGHCQSVVNHWVVPPAAPPAPDADDDCDGYPSSAGVPGKAPESFIGTDANDKCANTAAANDEAGMDAWPVDFNDDQKATLVDITQYSSRFGAIGPNPPYGVRWDLNGDGRLTLVYITQFSPLFGKSCSP
jgi:hypothetical protein